MGSKRGRKEKEKKERQKRKGGWEGGELELTRGRETKGRKLLSSKGGAQSSKERVGRKAYHRVHPFSERFEVLEFVSEYELVFVRVGGGREIEDGVQDGEGTTGYRGIGASQMIPSDREQLKDDDKVA